MARAFWSSRSSTLLAPTHALAFGACDEGAFVEPISLPPAFRPLPIRSMNALGRKLERLGWSGLTAPEEHEVPAQSHADAGHGGVL